MSMIAGILIYSTLFRLILFYELFGRLWSGHDSQHPAMSPPYLRQLFFVSFIILK